MPELRLLPFERHQLPLAGPWFEDDETNRWLGGPRWPQLILGLADRPLGEYRGAAETGRYNWLAWEGGTAIGYIGCDSYDRWTTWDGAPGGRGVTGAVEVPAANLSYVVDPALRRCGHGTAMINAALVMPALAHVALFAAGVEPANAASVRCLRKAGFAPLDPDPDWEGIVSTPVAPVTATRTQPGAKPVRGSAVPCLPDVPFPPRIARPSPDRMS